VRPRDGGGDTVAHGDRDTIVGDLTLRRLPPTTGFVSHIKAKVEGVGDLGHDALAGLHLFFSLSESTLPEGFENLKSFYQALVKRLAQSLQMVVPLIKTRPVKRVPEIPLTLKMIEKPGLLQQRHI